MQAQLHEHEAQRLAALRRYHTLDTPDQQAFDDVARTVAHACRAPLAAVTLVDESRFWFKSKVGVGATATVPVEASFAKHATLLPDPLIVEDATKDERFARHPLVAGEPFVRFYAGAALETPDGWSIGALWVADSQPRELAGPDLEALRALARQTMALFELGRANAEQACELARLDQVVRERSLLLQELQHRVRNNLQVIESLIALQMATEKGCSAREALGRIQTRLRPLLLIDRQLETDEPLADVDLATFLDELCRHLVDLHGSDRRVDLVASLEPTMMTRERAVSIGLIVNEFVTNSFKHAFSRRGGKLGVTLARDHGRLSLTLADDGRGMSLGCVESGLGLRIIPALVEQLDGALEWRNGTGTTLTVSL